MSLNKKCASCKEKLSDIQDRNLKNGNGVTFFPCPKCGIVFCDECAVKLTKDGKPLVCTECETDFNEYAGQQAALAAIQTLQGTI